MSAALFFIALLVLVVAHEFGHFIVAKRSGIRVDEFAFGFPPRLFSYKKGETTYVFNALPLGGYVKIYGENPDEVAEADRVRSFGAQPKYIQGAVIVAGVIANLILAWFLISGTLLIGIQTVDDPDQHLPISNARLTLTGISEHSPAAAAGLTTGDILIAISDGADKVVPKKPDDVIDFVRPREGRPLYITYEREGMQRETAATPVSGIVPGGGAVGISMDMVGTLRLPVHQALLEGSVRTYRYTLLTAKGIFGFFGGIVRGQSDFSQVTGPVGIVKAVGEASQFGIANLLLFAALISINLAVINLVPFPALDGGRLLFVVIEAIIRRPIPPRVANMTNMAGFAILMLLMIVVTYHDISRML